MDKLTKILAENLSAKYFIAESPTCLNEQMLDEAFSPSMPHWLVSALNQDAYYPHDALLQQDLRKPRRLKNPDAKWAVSIARDGVINDDDSYGYSTPRDDYARSLLAGFLHAGIDVSSAKFIHDGTVPTSAFDARVKAPNIPIFLLEFPGGKTQVYGKGLNDQQKIYRKNIPFKDISMKELLSRCIEFCYVDSSNPENLMQGRRDARQTIDQELSKIPDYYRQKDYVGTGKGILRGQRDKSGYIVNPQKYIDKLKASGKYSYARQLQQIYDRLVRARDDFAQGIGGIDLEDPASPVLTSASSTHYELLSAFRNAVSGYQRLLNDARSINANSTQSDYKNVDSLINMVNYRVDDLERKLDNAHFRTYTVDW